MRLKPEALRVRWQGESMGSISEKTLADLERFIRYSPLTPEEEALVGPVMLELKNRLRVLNEVGLGYLTLDRLSRTLSGGESQRINLATSLGSSLVDTLYVLDEPSIGLHERDNQLLINILKELRDLGNTVVVVEHDATMIRAADQVIDLGPGAGEKGGEILFKGPLSGLVRSSRSLTARYLKGKESIAFPADKRWKTPGKKLLIEGASEHNLKDIRVEIPLGQFVVVTGVSGSGKSTLIHNCLYGNFLRKRGRSVQDVGCIRKIAGWEHLADMSLIDQSPVGRSPRSNPVTYLKAFDDIRKCFSGTRDAKLRRLSSGDFSFNVPGGRCPVCEGDGKIKVEMHFLADVYIECEACSGTRYQPHILEVKYREKNIHEVLNLSVDEAFEFFGGEERLLAKLDILRKVGLNYLRLGQSSLTLSRGEAQRLKLAAELMGENRTGGNVLYIFDEPTTGLHYHDIQFLMNAFAELLERGNSLVVIEHNMEVIKCADHLIDLGPEGGEQGGEVVYQGPLKGILKAHRSYTGQFLRKYF
jgi:excinuclease ABC subunit A